MRNILQVSLFILFQVLSAMSQDCKDKLSLCRRFTTSCNKDKYKVFLSIYCQGTCNQFCPPNTGCQNKKSYCPFFKSSCQNRKLRSFLRRNCQRTCPRFCNSASPEWLAWSDYDDCNQSCGGGEQTRRRECNTGNDDDCEGSSSETISCNTQACPAVSDGDCSVPCGGGTYTQTIPCHETADPNCVVEESDTFYCNLEACEPEDGTRWSSWSDCEPACGPGTQTKTRGDVTISRSCIVSTCPDSDGSYECTKACGGGTRYDGNNYFDCNTEACPGETCPQQYGYQPRDGVNNHECCDKSNTLGQTCGIKTSNSRIVGGQSVSISVWPWMVQLHITKPDGQYLCGGLLLNKNYVLTAAHCLVGGVKSNGVAMIFGSTALDEVDLSAQIRDSDSFHIHEDYNFPHNDIAIVQFSSPVTFTAFVEPLCLPQGEEIKDDTQCYVAGWGNTVFGGFISNILQEVAVRILPGAMCEEVYGSSYAPSEKVVCAGRVSGGVDSCQGDSGGPLMCQRCASCGFFVAGVVSFGNGCASPNNPGVYTRVSYFEDWIYEKMGEVTGDRPRFPSC